jgi:hypothetical protein
MSILGAMGQIYLHRHYITAITSWQMLSRVQIGYFIFGNGHYDFYECTCLSRCLFVVVEYYLNHPLDHGHVSILT